MDEQLSQAIASVGSELAILAAKGTVSAVSNKLKQIRGKKDRDTMANEYEEVISELIQERNEAIAIAQSYQAELGRYQISDEDIEHLQRTAQTALDIMQKMTPEADLSAFKQFKELISVDTLKAMQLLGFDYRAGIGDPLTEACASAIKRSLSGGQVYGKSAGRKQNHK